ncbi:MAG: hypothetical protein V1899_05385 [Planctomycetota bacterium]
MKWKDCVRAIVGLLLFSAILQAEESGKAIWQFEPPGRPCQKWGKYDTPVSPLVTEEYEPLAKPKNP